jgi:RNA polymerase sigma-70 factor (ECF subfamily)
MSKFDFTQKELDSLFGYCRTLLNDYDEAYDLLYSSLEKYLKRLPRDSRTKFSYIRMIIRNLWIDNFRKYKPVFEVITPENQESIGYLVSDKNLIENELINNQELEIAWQKMSVEEREIIYLYIIDGLSMEAVGKQLGTSKNRIAVCIYRVRDRLRAHRERREKQQLSK